MGNYTNLKEDNKIDNIEKTCFHTTTLFFLDMICKTFNMLSIFWKTCGII